MYIFEFLCTIIKIKEIFLHSLRTILAFKCQDLAKIILIVILATLSVACKPVSVVIKITENGSAQKKCLKNHIFNELEKRGISQ